MFEIINELDDFFLAVFHHIYSHPYQEAVTAAVLGALLILVIVLHGRTSRVISERDWGAGIYSRFVTGLIFPLIYLMLVTFSSHYLRGAASLVVFETIAYLYLGFFFLRSLLVPLKLGYVPWNAVSYVLLVSACFFLLLGDMNALFFEDEALHRVFSLAFKLSVILLVYVLVISGLRFLTAQVSDRYGLVKSILANLAGFVSVLYLIIAALWLFQIIGVASSFFVGGVVIFIAVVVYGFLKTYVATRIKPRVAEQRSEYSGLDGNMDAFLNLALLYALYHIFIVFFNLGHVTSYLSHVYIIETGVVYVSVMSLITGVFVFFFLVSAVGILKHAVYFLNIRRHKELEAGSLRSLVASLGLLIATMVGLSALGLTWKVLLPVAGALGIGIGIGLQNIMNNYISGFILLFSKRLKIGDIIEIEGNAGRAVGNTLETIYGKVSSIDTFSCVVTTTDGIEIVVPNSQFIEQKIVNYSLSDYTIRVRIPFGVSYSSDPNTVRDILLSVAAENTTILGKPAPNVWFDEYGDSALIFYLLVWVNIRVLWRVRPLVSDIYFKTWYELDKAGVVIPFPQRDVWFKNNLKVEIEKEFKGEKDEPPSD